MSTSQPRTTSERSDDIPLIIYWLLQLKLPKVLDEVLPEPHGNRQGLSYGQLSVVLLSYIMTQVDHRLCAVEDWVKQHHQTLSIATGWSIGLKDASDDRLASLLEVIGAGVESREQAEEQLGQRMIQAYELPTEVARCDTSSFSVYHQTEEENEATSLLRFGHSKNHRPDLRQYRQLLGTIDPAGVPLVSETLAGNGADEKSVPAHLASVGESDWTQRLYLYCRLQSSSSSNQNKTSTSWRALLFSFANDGTYPQFIEKLGTQSTYSLARASFTQLCRV